MTPAGRQAAEILLALMGRYPGKEGWFTAREVAEHFPGLEGREKPVMTVSSYLTHLKRSKYVERRAAADKQQAWWRLTDKGRRALDASQGQAAS
jgi:hypothetical protein